MTDTKKEGGAEWEAGEAWKLIIQARVDGDSEAERLGWVRYKEALVNAAGAAAAAVLIVLDSKIDRLITQTDNASRAALDWRTGLREHLDARFDHFGNELDGLRQLAADGAARLGKTEADVRDLELRMENSEHLASDTRDRLTRLEAVNERLASIEEVMASRPALREAEYRAIAERAAEEAIRRLEARGDGE